MEWRRLGLYHVSMYRKIARRASSRVCQSLWLSRSNSRVESGVGGRFVAITAHYTRHWWRASKFGAMHLAFPGAYFDSLGVPRLGTLTTSTH